MRQPPVAVHQHHDSRADQDSRTDVVVKPPDDWHDEEHRERARHQHQARLIGGIVEKILGELRKQKAGAEQREAGRRADPHPKPWPISAG